MTGLDELLLQLLKTPKDQDLLLIIHDYLKETNHPAKEWWHLVTEARYYSNYKPLAYPWFLVLRTREPWSNLSGYLEMHDRLSHLHSVILLEEKADEQATQ